MNEKDMDTLQHIYSLLDEGHVEEAQDELRKLMPAVYAPQEFPKWVHDPSGKHPSVVVKDADGEKAAHERWSRPEEAKVHADAFGPIPAPGSSLPPLPGEKKRIQMPDFPQKDDVRIVPPEGGKPPDVKPMPVMHDDAKPMGAKPMDAKPVEAKVEEANPNPAKGPMPADNKSEETMVASPKAPMPVENKADDAKSGKN